MRFILVTWMNADSFIDSTNMPSVYGEMTSLGEFGYLVLMRQALVFVGLEPKSYGNSN